MPGSPADKHDAETWTPGHSEAPDWEPFHQYRTEIEVLPITEPPCRWCQYWQPHRTWQNTSMFGLEFAGVICCVGPAMHPDFSCYIKRRQDTEAEDAADDIEPTEPDEGEPEPPFSPEYGV